MLPGEFGDVDEAVDTTEVDERTEVNDRGDVTGTNLTLAKSVEEVRANLGLGLFKPCATREHNVVAVLVELDDLRFDLATNVRCEVADATHFNEGCGEEAAKADVEDKTTLDDLDDGAGNNAIFFLDLFDLAPGALVLCALLRQEQTAFLVFLLEDEGFDLVANSNNIVRVHVVLDGELAREDNALSLVADVEEDLIVVNLDDSALDDVAIVEVLDGCVDGGKQIFGRADVINRDLRRIGGHVVVSPKRTE